MRCNTTNPAQSSLWFRSQGGSLIAEHTATVTDAVLGNTLRGGSDNTFVNGTNASSGNIERLDFVFTDGLTANATLAFAVTDRGGTSNHDAFQIALITGWDGGTNNVTAYSDVAAQAPNWSGGGQPHRDFFGGPGGGWPECELIPRLTSVPFLPRCPLLPCPMV